MAGACAGATDLNHVVWFIFVRTFLPSTVAQRTRVGVLTLSEYVLISPRPRPDYVFGDVGKIESVRLPRLDSPATMP